MIKDTTTIMSDILNYEDDKRIILKDWANHIIDLCIKICTNIDESNKMNQLKNLI